MWLIEVLHGDVCLVSHDASIQLFSDPDTSLTESTRAAGAAGILLLMTFVYCLGYPIVKAFRRAKEAREMGSGVDDKDNDDLESREEMPVEEEEACSNGR